MSTPVEVFTDTRVVYLGVRVLSDNSLGESYITEQRLRSLVDARALPTIEYAASRFDGPKKGAKGGPNVVGGVYLLPAIVKPDGGLQTLKPGLAKYESTIGDDPDLSEVLGLIRAEDEMSRRLHRSLTAGRKKVDALDVAMGTVAFYYRNLSPNLRNAFKLELLNRLDSGK